MNIEKVNKPIKNILYSIVALVLYNGVIQFAVYPYFSRQMEVADFGIVLSLHSFLIIVAGACGTAANNSRMVTQLKFTPSKGDYNFVLLLLGLASMVSGTIYIMIVAKTTISSSVLLLYGGLMFFMLLRFYGDVEFRLRIDYKNYFIYYLFISVGYCLGLIIYHITKQWILTLLIGEILAIIFVVWKGNVFTAPILQRTPHTFTIWKSTIFLLTANLISLLIVNSDRILLLFFESGEAVTAYYVASLLGKLFALLTGPLSGVMLSYLVSYKGALSNKMFMQVTGLIVVLSVFAFAFCLLLSPWFVKVFYSSLFKLAKPILALAIAGQIIFFAAGVLRIFLMRFFEEKYQTYLNIIYGSSFFIITILALSLGGLKEFAWAVLIANTCYFLLLFGFGIFKIQKQSAF